MVKNNVIFVGLVDKSAHRKDMLSSSYWKDCPNSYYWDTWKAKLFKINEKGQNSGISDGYGCMMDCLGHSTESEMHIGIKYNYVERSVSFTLNGVDLGTAFKDVPVGLTPSIDLWFEAGQVEIEQNEPYVHKTYL